MQTTNGLLSVKREREKTNKMQQSGVYYQHCLNMFRASLCPSSGEQRPCVTVSTAVTHGLFFPEDGHNDARKMLRQC